MAYRPFLHRLLYGLAASSLFLALLTDLAYFASSDFLWVDMSDWLVTTGVVVGVVALIVGIVETIAAPRWRRPSWGFALACLATLAVAALNMLVHTRDGLTSVVPLGMGLSALTTLLLIVVWWADSATVGAPFTDRIPA